MTRRTPKSVKASCDRLFSQLIRSRGECENCGERKYEQLQCAHNYSRKFGSVRFDQLNAFCLCARCHRHFHDEPMEFSIFISEQMTEVEINELRRRKNMIVKRKLADWLELEAELKKKLDESN